MDPFPGVDASYFRRFSNKTYAVENAVWDYFARAGFTPATFNEDGTQLVSVHVVHKAHERPGIKLLRQRAKRLGIGSPVVSRQTTKHTGCFVWPGSRYPFGAISVPSNCALWLFAHEAAHALAYPESKAHDDIFRGYYVAVVSKLIGAHEAKVLYRAFVTHGLPVKGVKLGVRTADAGGAD